MKLVGETDTPVTGIGIPGITTVTKHVAVRFEPSVVAAAIIAVPALANDVTTPFNTAATVGLLDNHDTAGFVVLTGRTVAVNVALELVNNDRDVGETVKDVADTDMTYSDRPNPLIEPSPVQLS